MDHRVLERQQLRTVAVLFNGGLGPVRNDDGDDDTKDFFLGNVNTREIQSN